MDLVSEYRRQFQWRDWPVVFNALPPLDGKTILDLGCAVGDVAAELAARGARVIGIDANAELVQEARARNLPRTEFRTGDLHASLNLDGPADGIWCSFTAAYFPDLTPTLNRWAEHLKPGGWIAITEIDDLFGHDPLSAPTKVLLDGYAEAALAARRYDFRMGRKLESYLQRAGFIMSKVLTISDHELSFDGCASPAVLTAWRDRFARMTLLRNFCGEKMDHVEGEFLGCLGRNDHHSLAKVYCCIASKVAQQE